MITDNFIHDLFPVKIRKNSLDYDVNFLWKYKNIYISDNHRVAMWCWLQEMDFSQKYNLIHIDRHSDTMTSNLDRWCEALPKNLNDITLSEYLNMEYSSDFGSTKIICWGNYLSVFLEKYKENINSLIYSFREGDLPNISKKVYYNEQEILENILLKVNGFSGKTIINLDIDYFFDFQTPEDEVITQYLSDTYISEIGNKLGNLKPDKVECLTIALSPECCFNWENAINKFQILLKAMGIDIKSFSENREILL